METSLPFTPPSKHGVLQGGSRSAASERTLEQTSGPVSGTASGSSSVSPSLSDIFPSFRDISLVLGIYVCFLGFGYFQESVFHARHSETGAPFTYPVFLVASLCTGNVLISALILYLESRTTVNVEIAPTSVDDTGVCHELKSPTATETQFFPEPPLPEGLSRRTTFTASQADDPSRTASIPKSAEKASFLTHYIFRIDKSVLLQIALSSLTYVLSMLCTNYALTHISYPTQVLVKSAKSVPVILGGALFFKKRYPMYDYVVVAVITAALALFNFTQHKPHVATGHGSQQTSLGLALLCVSLLCDSMTGPRQDQLLARVTLTSTHLMFLTNIFATLVAVLSCLVLEGLHPILFCLTTPHIIRSIILFCVSGTAGQLFIFGSLTAFGSLRLALITTTRKFFTVLLSVLLFGHSISTLQWVCVVSIFIALAVQSYNTKKLKRKAVQCSKAAA